MPSDRKLDGHDIWPLLAGQDQAESPYDAFYYFRGLELQAVRSGPWKLRLKERELYHLADDIGESANVADRHPEVVQRLQGLAEKMDSDLGVNGIGPGCRPLGKVSHAQPLIDHEGRVRDGFEPR